MTDDLPAVLKFAAFIAERVRWFLQKEKKENIRHPQKRLIARPGSLKLAGCTDLGFQKRRRR